MSTTAESRATARGRTWRRALACFAVAGLVIAACGDDDDGGDTASTADAGDEAATTDAAADTAAEDTAAEETTAEGTTGDGTAAEGTTGEAPSGDPIKVMTVTTLNAAGPTYENIANTANLYADYINARGGIAGRPLEVMVCDEQFDPAVATTATPR